MKQSISHIWNNQFLILKMDLHCCIKLTSPILEYNITHLKKLIWIIKRYISHVLAKNLISVILIYWFQLFQKTYFTQFKKLSIEKTISLASWNRFRSFIKTQFHLFQNIFKRAKYVNLVSKNISNIGLVLKVLLPEFQICIKFEKWSFG